MMFAAITVLALADEEIKAATVPPITFLVTAIIGVAIILLGFDLVRRVRRAQYREEIQQSLEAEILERDANSERDANAVRESSAERADGAGSDSDAGAGSADGADRDTNTDSSESRG